MYRKTQKGEEMMAEIMKKKKLKDIVAYILLVAVCGVLGSFGLDNVHPEDWFA